MRKGVVTTSCRATRATSSRPALPSSSSVRRCSAPASATSQRILRLSAQPLQRLSLFFCAVSTRTATPTAWPPMRDALRRLSPWRARCQPSAMLVSVCLHAMLGRRSFLHVLRCGMLLVALVAYHARVLMSVRCRLHVAGCARLQRCHRCIGGTGCFCMHRGCRLQYT